MLTDYRVFSFPLQSIDNQKKLICTINAHSYNLTNSDHFYRESLLNCDILIPDGISVVWAYRWLKKEKIEKIAGADLFFYEMNRLQSIGGKCFFLGSTESTLKKIKLRISKDYPKVQVEIWSPPFKPEFTIEENSAIINAINLFQPDALMVGMTAPKQEKWAYFHYEKLNVGHICCIGAVFDFYAGTIKRSPDWMIKLGLEWLYRLIKEPGRLWHRYLVGNTRFIISIISEKIRE